MFIAAKNSCLAHHRGWIRHFQIHVDARVSTLKSDCNSRYIQLKVNRAPLNLKRPSMSLLSKPHGVHPRDHVQPKLLLQRVIHDCDSAARQRNFLPETWRARSFDGHRSRTPMPLASQEKQPEIPNNISKYKKHYPQNLPFLPGL